MPLIIGLDTGGTYTDGVLFDPERGVLASGKSLTTKHDLSIGLEGALAQVLPAAEGRIDLVCISTTLATNAVVEGHGSPVGLLMIGFDERVLERSGLGEALGGDPAAYIPGGHSPFGTEEVPLGVDEARKAIEQMAPRVGGFAIAGMFAVRNPEHERALADLASELTGLPATCSHELSAKLDAPKRALTAVLNARLIPQLKHLIEAVEQILQRVGIDAPLMVVKGDGSLEDAAVALRRPVETILSGPAASLVGAHYLSREDDGIVVDMGGTTTDIVLLHDGVPVINEDGATVGGWKTMVEAVSIHTFGLGGDSEVHVETGGGIRLGPRRCMPISLLVHQHPEVLEILNEQVKSSSQTYHGQFALRLRRLGEQSSLPASQQRLWDALAQGPVSLCDLQGDGLTGRPLMALVDRGLVLIAGFTPSDAAHVLGLHDAWSEPAARCAASLWLRKQMQGRPLESVEVLAQIVLETLVRQSGRGILGALINESIGLDLERGGELGNAFVDWFLDPGREAKPLFRPAFQIERPLVAIGAPVATYYPAVAERLGVRLAIPQHAEVANAVGAASAGIMQLVSVLVSKPEKESYRVHLPDGVQDLGNLEEAYALAERSAESLARQVAEQAGAVDVRVSRHRKEKIFHTNAGVEVFLEAIVTAKAVGRPRYAGD
ncbi:MAG TPA: hydantoinase/oxoprolinase family protein [Myxococcota bacterium]